MSCLCAMPSDSMLLSRYVSIPPHGWCKLRSPIQLERIVYQFHTLSFFLSPSLLTYLCRTMFQFQFARPREIDPKRSLRFWYFLILLFNVGSVWAHATEGAAKGRSIMLDFIGPSMLYPCTSYRVVS